MSASANVGDTKTLQNFIASTGAVGAGGGSGSNSFGRAGSSSSSSESWLAALAKAWGGRLDAQASRISNMSDAIGSQGDDQPSSMVQLTTESMRFQILSNNAATSTNSVAQGLEGLAKKQ